MQYRFISITTVVAVIVTTFMAVYSYISRSMPDFYSNIVYAVLAAAIHVDLKKNSNEKRSSILLLIYFLIVEIVLVFRLNPESLGHVILIIFPLLAYILTGRNRGLILSSLYSIGILFLLGVVRGGLPVWSIVLFLIASIIVSVICSVYESTGEMVISELEKTVTELEEQKQKIAEIAIHDELTGLYNRRWFNEQFPKEIQRCRRQNIPMGFFILDVDYFKQYNDNNGHLAGDHALQKVSAILQLELRRGGDMVFRLGGEEFGGIIAGDSREQLIRTCQRLCLAIEEAKIPRKYSEVSQFLTASIGLTILESSEDNRTEDDLYLAADEELYRAKDSGRNRVSVD